MFVVFPSSKYYEPLMADVPRWLKDHNQSALDGFSILHCDSASSTFLHGLSGRNMWNSFDMLNHASTTQKTVCSFELSLFSCLLTLVYQLISRVCMHSFIDAYYSCDPSSHSILNNLEKQTPVPHPYLGLGQSSCIPQIKCQSSFWFCSTLEYYHLLYRDCYRNCTPSYELLVQWYFLPSLFIPRFLYYCNRNADKWIVMCEINTASNSAAW